MKKQNSNNKLVFSKTAVAELNDNQLQEVNGGSMLTAAISAVVLTVIMAEVL